MLLVVAMAVVLFVMHGVADRAMIFRQAIADRTALPPKLLMMLMSSPSGIWASCRLALVSTSSKRSVSKMLVSCFFVASNSRTFALTKRSFARDWNVSSPSSNSLLNWTKDSDATTSGSGEVKVIPNLMEVGGPFFSIRLL